MIVSGNDRVAKQITTPMIVHAHFDSLLPLHPTIPLAQDQQNCCEPTPASFYFVTELDVGTAVKAWTSYTTLQTIHAVKTTLTV